MSEIAFGVAGIAALVFYCAWREYADDNRRDAKLLAAFGAGGLLTAAGLLI